MRTEAPFIAVVPPVLVVSEVNAVAAPTAPPKVVAAVVFTPSENAPSTVLASVTAPPALSAVFALSMTASL